MARLAQRCGAPGCPAIQPESYCPEHAKPAWSRGPHPSRWAKLSRAIRKQRPVCEWPNCTRLSEEVHHVDGLGPTGPAGLDPSNLRAYCRQHHGQVTAWERIAAGRW